MARPVTYPRRLPLTRLLTLFGVGVALLGLLTTPSVAQDIRSKQWYLNAMQADDMWKVSTGEGVTVAVIDDEIDPSVPELKGKVLEGRDFSQGPLNFEDETGGHGTNMALLIAGSGEGGGVRGLAPGVKILPIAGGGTGLVDQAVRSIRYAADQGAQIINMSMGFPAIDEERRRIESAVKYASRKGSLVFAASGNNGDESNVPSSPADIPGVIAIGAIDESLTVADFSAHGPHLALSAPGVGIPALCTKSSGYCATQGTSQATALASASAALIWSAHPDWTNNQVLRVMLETAGKPDDGKVPNPYLGYGTIRPRKVLLDGEGNPGDPNVNPLVSAQAPSGSPTPPSDGKRGESTKDESEQSEEATSTTDADNSVPLWAILAGSGTIALVLVSITVTMIRRRQRADPGAL